MNFANNIYYSVKDTEVSFEPKLMESQYSFLELQLMKLTSRADQQPAKMIAKDGIFYTMG